MKARVNSTSKRFILLGSSRGLGWATYQALSRVYPESAYLLSSRKIQEKAADFRANTECSHYDFSQGELTEDFLRTLENFHGTHLIYFAGGGPYGFFSQKKWSAHQWCLETTFLFPARLLHEVLGQQQRWASLEQIIFIGSAVAENQADPQAASYAAAKHALKGLITTVQQENLIANNRQAPEILLFSPGYMQTDLLPLHSEPRQKGLAEKPEVVAEKLIAMIQKID